MRSAAPSIALVAALALAAGSAAASADARAGEAEPGPERPRWRGSIGAGVLVNDQPYRGVGSDAIPVPILDLRFGRWFARGLYAGFGLAQTDRATWTLFVRPDFTDLDPGEAPILEGMAGRSMSWLAGARASFEAGRYEIEAEAAHDVSGEHDGGWIGVGVGRGFRAGPRTRIAPSLGARWESAEYLDAYYGVRAAEARPGRPAYRAGSGVAISADMLALRRLSPRISLVTRLSWERLPDAVAESPLVDTRSKTVGILGLAWSVGPAGGRPGVD